MDSNALGKLIVTLHSGNPIHAMNNEPYLDSLILRLLLLHYGH
jgi:hypothetical protein